MDEVKNQAKQLQSDTSQDLSQTVSQQQKDSTNLQQPAEPTPQQPLEQTSKPKRRKWLIIGLVILVVLALLGILFVARDYGFTSLVPTTVRKYIPLISRRTYSSIKEALQGDDYEKYPAVSIPVRGTYNNIQFNPKTNTQLELDTSEGGGYACCEAPTFYVWVDRKDNIFWVRTYQASLGSVNDNWYGPFRLQTSN